MVPTFSSLRDAPRLTTTRSTATGPNGRRRDGRRRCRSSRATLTSRACSAGPSTSGSWSSCVTTTTRRRACSRRTSSTSSTLGRLNVAGTQYENPAQPLDRNEPRIFQIGLIRTLRLTDTYFRPDWRTDPGDPRYRNGILCAV